jgi:hypothetical protein
MKPSYIRNLLLIIVLQISFINVSDVFAARQPKVKESSTHDKAVLLSETGSIKSLTANVAEFYRSNPQEKVYLHFDNTAYFLGETIWFKAYLAQVNRNSLSQISKTLYVELLSPEGNVIETKKFKINDGLCNGEIFLRDSLKNGFYEVRAYTRHMLNFDNSAVFSRVFPVYDKPIKKGNYSLRRITEKPRSQRVPGPRMDIKTEKFSINFFPEGGNLVDGLSSRIAFQSFSDKAEHPVIEGFVVSVNNDTSAVFSTSHFNMGSFYLKPDIKKAPYKVLVNYNGSTYKYQLPDILSSGYVMTTDVSDSDVLNILISKSPGLPSEALGINIVSKGQLYGSDSIVVGDENVVSLSFPKRMIPSGVSQITLFDKKGNVLADRKVFVNHMSQMKIASKFDKQSYRPHEKVNMDFQISDYKGNPVETGFSVSIRDASTTSVEPYTYNILTNLLLSSDLKGFVESPGYYFNSNDVQTMADADLLMLTQGWSRYVWRQMAGVEKVVYNYPYEKSLLIEGNIYSLSEGKKPKKDVEVNMILLGDSVSQQGKCFTDETGRFNFAPKDFFGKPKLTVQTKYEGKNAEFNIRLDRFFSPVVKDYNWLEKRKPEIIEPEVAPDTLVAEKQEDVSIKEAEKKLTMAEKDHMLKQVEIIGKNSDARIRDGLRKASIVMDVENTVDKMIDTGEFVPESMLEFLTRTNPYFTCYTEVVGNKVKLRPRYKSQPAFFVINNFEVFDRDEIEGLMTKEIQLISISEDPAEHLKFAQAGTKSLSAHLDRDTVVIYVFTYQDRHTRDTPEGIRQTSMQGYSLSREFYSPNYTEGVLPGTTDVRRTLYWNPNVFTGKDGKASVSFFNNSNCRSMNVSAETVTSNGMIGVGGD